MNSFLDKCNLEIKQCVDCLSYHFISYAIQKQSNTKRFYVDAHTYDYFHFTNETIFETKLLNNLMADTLFKQSSFRSFAETYNFLYSIKVTDRFRLNAKRLADAFYCYHISKYYFTYMRDTPLQSKNINMKILYFILSFIKYS